MKRRSFLVAVTLIASSTVAQGGAAQDGSAQDRPPQDVAAGTIEQVDTARSSLVVRTSAGDTRTAQITPLTRVTIDGMPGEVSDLRPGQRVEVRFAVTRSGAARPELVRIDVHTRPRPHRP
ncbi:MAG: hypothetical protein M3Y87_05230 [Myxococcota bacterium]|nr:hypothetical protein [Myxococcota bacterium]